MVTSETASEEEQMAVQTDTWSLEFVRGEVLDAITEEIVQARGPAGRAVIIAELIQEISATVDWLHDTRPDLDDAEAAELIAVARLSRTARDHRNRLSDTAPDRRTPCRPTPGHPQATQPRATSRSTT